MAQLIGESPGKEPRITLAPALLGEVTHYVADITKARELLGFDPQVPLDEGIQRTVDWNREWARQQVSPGGW